MAPAETATLSARPYAPADRAAWNDFVRRAKNGVFLFERDYMEYHADRFQDHSLLIEESGKLIALVPGNVAGDAFVSHGGLTFGGVICDARMRAGTMLRVFAALLRHLDGAGIRTVVYKAIPHIYHRMPAEEDLYALFRCGAMLVRRDVAAAVERGCAAPYTKGRKWGVKKGRGSGVTLEQSNDFEAFMAVEEANLAERHNVRPVHTAAELTLLAQRFPGNIRLYVAREGEAIAAGTILYASERVAHTQYIATTARGRELCALDALLDWLMREELAAWPVFDFGISTERAGRVLNEGLAENKESYGARGVVYDHYEMAVADALRRLEAP